MDILSKIIHSSVRSKLFDYFIANEGKEIHLRGLQKELGINPRQLTLELQNLKEISFLKEKKVGNMKLYKVNKGVFYYDSLKQFITSFSSKSDWYQWERASTIHPIHFVLEATALHFESYFGIKWSSDYLIYTDEILLWSVKESDIEEIGEQLIAWMNKTINFEKYRTDVEERSEKLIEINNEIGNKNLEKLTNKELLQLYGKFKKIYVAWWTVVVLTSVLYIYMDKEIDKATEYLDLAYRNILKAMSKKSFSQEIEKKYEDLVMLATKVGLDFNNSEFKKEIERFQKNYFWMFNNYYETKVLSEEDIVNKVRDRTRKTKERKNVLDIEAEKRRIYKECNINTNDIKLIELNDFFAYQHDTRKKMMMQSTHYLELLLKEIGNRSGYSIKEMRYTLPHELQEILNGEKKDFAKRAAKFMIISDPTLKKLNYYEDKKAYDESEKLLSKVNSEVPTVLKGNIGCPGKALGTVKVIMNPKELYRVNHGDVLVTSMTSPEFVVAMRKIVGIVTNEGGLTCHAAVLSRELNIPCVIGTKDGTKVLKDGYKVEVDADKGEVKVIK